jgi:hypothetical protein
LPSVCTAYPAPPLLPFFNPPIQLAGSRPRGRLDLDGWLDLSAISFWKLPYVVIGEVHIQLEHVYDSVWKGAALRISADVVRMIKKLNFRSDRDSRRQHHGEHDDDRRQAGPLAALPRNPSVTVRNQ